MKLSVAQIAELLDAEIIGDPTIEVDSVSGLEAGRKGSISFLANPKYLPFLFTTAASAVLVSQDFVPEKPVSAVLLKVPDPYSAFSRLLSLAEAEQMRQRKGIESPSYIADTAELGKDVYVGAFAYIGENAKIGDHVRIFPNVYIGDGAEIGDHTILYPNAVIYRSCKVGKNCIIHAGAAIGSDGFGFAPQADGTYVKIPQTGTVELGDGVEVGANTTVDRATLGVTLIGEGVKLDNLVQIAHNVEIGPHTVIAAQTGISGSTKLGARCMLGGQVGVVGHIQLADGTRIGAQSGVSKSVKQPDTALRGSPAQEYRKQLRTEVLLRKLEEMHDRISRLESKKEEA
jgi:UDP-3-O-[3-hydroxymyristoyl] glucosamine N-acyltransferase